MLNLLPPQEKQRLLREENFKLILILGITFLLFLVCLSFILLSLKIHLSAQVTKKELPDAQLQELAQEISLTNEKFLQLSGFYKNQAIWTERLQRVALALPENSFLTALSLSSVPKEKNVFQISLSGFSPDRENLFEFKKGLESQPDFQEIYFPPASWVDPTDFNVTFKLAI